MTTVLWSLVVALETVNPAAKNFRVILHESGANFLRVFADKDLRRIYVLIKRLPLSNRSGVSRDIFDINGTSKLLQESSLKAGKNLA